jgi:DUF2934 family protein
MLEREQCIRVRAYSIWEQEGRPEGRSLFHWQQAESEIESEQAPRSRYDRKRPHRPTRRKPLSERHEA